MRPILDSRLRLSLIAASARLRSVMSDWNEMNPLSRRERLQGERKPNKNRGGRDRRNEQSCDACKNRTQHENADRNGFNVDAHQRGYRFAVSNRPHSLAKLGFMQRPVEQDH